MRNSTFKSSQSGLTLIELMIVVAILGIITSIALPAYINYTREAANNACLSEASQYAKKVMTEIQLGRLPDAPIANACHSINGGLNITELKDFKAIPNTNVGSGEIICNMTNGTSCHTVNP